MNLNKIAWLVKALRSTWKAYRGKRFGDVAALKIALSGAEPEMLPPHQLSKILDWQHQPLLTNKNYPRASLGEHYARFLRNHHLSTLNFSEEVDDLLAKYPVTTRYIRLHDLIHVLLGFDASLIGELGVYGFVKGQRYSPTLEQAADRARLLFPVARFPQRSVAYRAWEHGMVQGQSAPNILLEPLESWLEEPIAEVRKRMSIAAWHSRHREGQL